MLKISDSYPGVPWHKWFYVMLSWAAPPNFRSLIMFHPSGLAVLILTTKVFVLLVSCVTKFSIQLFYLWYFLFCQILRRKIIYEFGKGSFTVCGCLTSLLLRLFFMTTFNTMLTANDVLKNVPLPLTPWVHQSIC